MGYGSSSISNSYANVSVNITVGTGGIGSTGGSGGYRGYRGNSVTGINGKTGSNGGNGTNGSAGVGSAGGICGLGGGTYISVYYNSSLASRAGSVSSTGITALTDANMKKKASFTNWDFDNVWDIVEDISYPYFLKEGTISISNTMESEYLTEQIYTRSQIKPEPVVRLKIIGTVLTNGKDYTLTYGENKNVGTGTVTITGNGDYLVDPYKPCFRQRF